MGLAVPIIIRADIVSKWDFYFDIQNFFIHEKYYNMTTE